MLDVAVRLIAAFAEDEEHGINEIAGSLPRTTIGGTSPADDDAAPPAVTIYNDSDEDGDEINPDTVPAFYFWIDSSAPIDMRGYKTARSVTIVGAYITETGVDTLQAKRDCGYILRAGLITLDRYNNQTYSNGYRELNGIRVLNIKSVTEQRLIAAVGRRKMWGFLTISAQVVETLQ